ncbi:MAG TPA: hypothetical protein VGE52_19190 [Pirellulales bacterium]
MPSTSHDPANEAAARRAARLARVERTALATCEALCTAARQAGSTWTVFEVAADDPDDKDPALMILLRWRGRVSPSRLERRLLAELATLAAPAVRLRMARSPCRGDHGASASSH